MTIATEKSEIILGVVFIIPVDVIHVKWNRLIHPLFNATPFTSVSTLGDKNTFSTFVCFQRIKRSFATVQVVAMSFELISIIEDIVT